MTEVSRLLYRAAESNDTAKLEQLIIEGADINYKPTKFADTPLYRALTQKSQESAIVLLKHGAILDCKHYGDDILHEAASNGNEKVVEWLLLEKRYEANHKSSSGEPALHVCSTAKVAQVLLAHGAELSAKDRSGRTALHGAVGPDSQGVLPLLIKKGLDVNSTDDRGYTPLHKAVCSPHYNLASAKLLLACGANPNAKTKEGKNPLHFQPLARFGRLAEKEQTIREVVAHGIDFDAQDDDGCTALHYTVFNPRLVRLYLDEGANINLKSSRDESPLEHVESYIESGDYLDSLPNLSQTSEYILQHIIKLKVAGLYVSEDNWRLAESILNEPNRSMLHNYDQECKLELAKFKLNIGLELNYLLTTQCPNYMANKDLCDRIERLVKVDDYPIYAKMILKKFGHDTERYALMKPCKTLLLRSKLEPNLPEEIWEDILSRLTNDELRAF